MLPSSHHALMNAAPPTRECESGRAAPEPAPRAGSGTAQLAEAFSAFIETSSRLEESYRELQGEVKALSAELAERNQALKASVNENELMRLSLQAIVDSMPCGVLVMNDAGDVSTINPECGRLLNFDAAGTGRQTQLNVRQIEEQAGMHLLQGHDADADGDTEQELCLRSDAGERWLQVRCRGMLHDAGRQRILIVRDVTAQKHAERDREAGRNAMALAEMTTILAHEIRNPLASLELFAELIERDEERRGEWIANMRAGIRSLAGTVNNVLAFHGRDALKLAAVDIGQLMEETVQFVQPLADQAKVTVQWQCGANGLMVRGHEGGLRQVMLNLLTNALRHTPEGGSVTLSARETEGRVLVECADSGCGLREEELASIFAPGFSGAGDRTGLGLAVCERIMKQHGGSICAENRAEGGARFVLELLRCDDEALGA